MSGRPGSNWPPIAWKAIALPNELLPHKKSSQRLVGFAPRSRLPFAAAAGTPT